MEFHQNADYSSTNTEIIFCPNRSRIKKRGSGTIFNNVQFGGIPAFAGTRTALRITQKTNTSAKLDITRSSIHASFFLRCATLNSVEIGRVSLHQRIGRSKLSGKIAPPNRVRDFLGLHIFQCPSMDFKMLFSTATQTHLEEQPREILPPVRHSPSYVQELYRHVRI